MLLFYRNQIVNKEKGIPSPDTLCKLVIKKEDLSVHAPGSRISSTLHIQDTEKCDKGIRHHDLSC